MFLKILWVEFIMGGTLNFKKKKKKLSQNFINILKDDEYDHITIEVGQDPEVKNISGSSLF